jgi:hypothetical protein
MENEFTNKLYLYKKLNLTPKPAKAISFRKFCRREIKTLNQKIKTYNINDTKLIMQDTTDLKSDILNEINFNKSILSKKDVTILNLK